MTNTTNATEQEVARIAAKAAKLIQRRRRDGASSDELNRIRRNASKWIAEVRQAA